MTSRESRRKVKLLLISGSLRTSSTNTAVLRTAAAVAPAGVESRLYDELARIPAFNPDDDRAPLPPEIERLRRAIHYCDGVVFSTPEYAGALPGSLKNLLDWTIGDDDPRALYDKPVCWLNSSPRGASGAHGELRTVLGYAHARIIEEACVSVPTTAAMIGVDGIIHDETSRVALTGAITRLRETLSTNYAVSDDRHHLPSPQEPSQRY
jgi:NAD(P)H-dependent FMN reductase